VKIRIEKTFAKDIDKIEDKKLLRKLRTLISTIQHAENIHQIPNIKKLEGYASYYRIKVGDYRLGLEITSDNEVILVRFLHRKDIYRYFLRKK